MVNENDNTTKRATRKDEAIKSEKPIVLENYIKMGWGKLTNKRKPGKKTCGKNKKKKKVHVKTFLKKTSGLNLA